MPVTCRRRSTLPLHRYQDGSRGVAGSHQPAASTSAARGPLADDVARQAETSGTVTTLDDAHLRTLSLDEASDLLTDYTHDAAAVEQICAYLDEREAEDRDWEQWKHQRDQDDADRAAQAEADCRGHLLNRAGQAGSIDPYSLFSGRYARVRRYGSEELREWFGRHGRLTWTEFRWQALHGNPTAATRTPRAGEVSTSGAREWPSTTRSIRPTAPLSTPANGPPLTASHPRPARTATRATPAPAPGACGPAATPTAAPSCAAPNPELAHVAGTVLRLDRTAS